MKQLHLNNNEKLDLDFVLSKSNLNNIGKLKGPKLIPINQKSRLDLTHKKIHICLKVGIPKLTNTTNFSNR